MFENKGSSSSTSTSTTCQFGQGGQGKGQKRYVTQGNKKDLVNENRNVQEIELV